MVCVDEDHPIPERTDDVSALVFMGAAVSVNDHLPWVEGELRLIRRALDEELPLMGVCFGAQLMRLASAGTGRADRRRVVRRTAAPFRCFPLACRYLQPATGIATRPAQRLFSTSGIHHRRAPSRPAVPSGDDHGDGAAVGRSLRQ
ncbi:MAG: gamma-glutamyl-gamma-aminobutyrate hydrolase family protein [Candidatus Thiodiazotropha sp.]